MISVKTFLEQAQNPDFWKNLNPQLSVGEDFTSLSGSVLSLEQEEMEKLLFNLKNEGYFQIDSFLSEAEISRMATGIEKLRESGWPVPFAFIYDEFWQTFCRLSQILSVILGEDYRQLPAFWAWYINTTNSEKGWQPHRDNGGNTLLPDGMPKCVTIWIPLSDAIPLNGCMYIVPAPFDPNYGGNVQKGEKKEIINFQDIRALPATAGSVLCWNHAVLHWGGRSSERAPHPRISLAFEFQRSDAEPYKTPLLDPSNPPDFNQRLGLIGKQILQYNHMYPLSEEMAEVATGLENKYLLPLLKNRDNSIMENQELDTTEKIRQQFDKVRYPKRPLEQSPKNDYQALFFHNIATAYYLRNQRVLNTEGKVILDAGCGSGYKSLVLAEANPGAKIIGIDLSEESVKLARQRLQYYGFDNAEFYALPIEQVSSLNIEFDYINNDEVLYLIPDPVVGLQAMKSVLKPDGIIRTNLHSSRQRALIYQAQTVFKMMGLMDGNPEELEIQLLREIMNSLDDTVIVKARTGKPEYYENEEWVLMNYLLQGDKGYTIPEVFAALKTANLELISMVNWRHWEVTDLFKDSNNLPAFLEMSLPEISVEERLHLFELLHPIHRLIDFWCGHPNQDQQFLPVPAWTLSDWQEAKVHLHPQLRNPQSREDLLNCITNHKPFDINCYVPLPTLMPVVIESNMAACLLPLWEGAQPMRSLVARWLKLTPLHPVTLESVSKATAFEQVKELLTRLESFLYVLLERSD
jgi:2-polyprenyl-3-methyl-5-hydroxy-6-metoxy-1,4-benzoquinol methylase